MPGERHPAQRWDSDAFRCVAEAAYIVLIAILYRGICAGCNSMHPASH